MFRLQIRKRISMKELPRRSLPESMLSFILFGSALLAHRLKIQSKQRRRQ